MKKEDGGRRSQEEGNCCRNPCSNPCRAGCPEFNVLTATIAAAAYRQNATSVHFASSPKASLSLPRASITSSSVTARVV